ncbi:MAG: alpha/beta fold hydrolase [Candidatus Binataceae bacterium]
MDSIWVAMLGQELRQTFYRAGAVRTRALEAGDGAPLIFLHGTGGHAEAYTRNLAAHAKHFHVYSIDMIGHGFSDRPEVSYNLSDYVNHVRDFIDAIGARRCIISGESLGAMVGVAFAARHPDRIEKIVLNTGMLGPRDDKGREELRAALERSRKAAGALTRETVRKRLEWLMYEPEKSVTEELVEIRYRIYSQPGMAPVMKKLSEVVFGAALDPSPAGEWDPAQMKSIKCPAMVLWTRHNPGRSVELAREGAKLIPNHRMAVLEKSAHWPQWEEPDEFNRIHLEFLLSQRGE